MTNLQKQRLRELALDLLAQSEGLSRNGGSFLGQIVAEPGALSDKQSNWLATLADRAGLSAQFAEIDHAE